MVEQLRVGKRGAVVIPALLRRRYHMEEGARLAIEERDDGLLLRALPPVAGVEERTRFFLELTERVRATRDIPVAWDEELANRADLEGTLLDGLNEPEQTDRG